MVFHVSLRKLPDGTFRVSCADPEAWATGPTRRAALELLRKEIRYRLELCPCSGVPDDYVELAVD